MNEIREGLDQDFSWTKDLEDHKKKTVLRMLENQKKELATLEARLKDIPELFNQVKGIYDEIVALEESGASQDEILRKFLADREEEIMAIDGLLEHGLEIGWGYIFIQGFLAERASS